MGSSSGGGFKQPSTPTPPSSMIAGPGQTAPFNPVYRSALSGDGMTPYTLSPDMFSDMGGGGGGGPPMRGGDGASAMTTNPGTVDRAAFAELMAQYNQDQMRGNFMNAALRAMNPGGPRGTRQRGGSGSDRGGYSKGR